jgi:hypothetical protein
MLKNWAFHKYKPEFFHVELLYKWTNPSSFMLNYYINGQTRVLDTEYRVLQNSVLCQVYRARTRYSVSRTRYCTLLKLKADHKCACASSQVLQDFCLYAKGTNEHPPPAIPPPAESVRSTSSAGRCRKFGKGRWKVHFSGRIFLLCTQNNAVVVLRQSP